MLADRRSPAARCNLRKMSVMIRCLLASLALTWMALSAPAQSTRLSVGPVPTNLRADWSQVFWAPTSAPDEFLLLAAFSGSPSDRFPFHMLEWDGHIFMQAWYPNGWFEVRFAFPEWAYLSNAPCAVQPPPHLPVAHAGIDSIYDYGPPLYTGPILGINQPLPGWARGDASVPYVGGHPSDPTSETFALFVTDYPGTMLNACTNGAPISWVAVRVRMTLVAH